MHSAAMSGRLASCSATAVEQRLRRTVAAGLRLPDAQAGRRILISRARLIPAPCVFTDASRPSPAPSPAARRSTLPPGGRCRSRYWPPATHSRSLPPPLPLLRRTAPKCSRCSPCAAAWWRLIGVVGGRQAVVAGSEAMKMSPLESVPPPVRAMPMLARCASRALVRQQRRVGRSATTMEPMPGCGNCGVNGEGDGPDAGLPGNRRPAATRACRGWPARGAHRPAALIGGQATTRCRCRL